jgi:bacillolysin
MKRLWLFLTGIVVLCNGIRAQVNDFATKNDAAVFYSVSNIGWVKFNPIITATPATLFQQYASNFALTNGYAMRLQKINQGTNGYTHYKYQQTYNGKDIVNGNFIVHTQNSRPISGNGKLYTPIKKSTTASVSEAAALSAALLQVNAKQYAWQQPLAEQRLKKKTNNSLATYYPKATQVYLYNHSLQSLQLCYRFYIKTIDAGKSCICLVDAATGKVAAQTTTEYHCDPTTFESNWYGFKVLYTNDVGVLGNSYNLADDCTASVLTVYGGNTGSVYNTSNNQWTTDRQRSAATTLWGVRQTLNDFNNFFGRNGHDNDGGDLDIYHYYDFGISPASNPNNASYSYDEFGIDELKFGAGSSPSVVDDWCTIDIAAHEFAHGVTQYEASLLYQDESGAINESFSDIFGEFFEGRITGITDWIVGKTRKMPANNAPAPIRYMIDPAGQNISIDGFSPYNFSNPNTYLGTNWTATGCTPSNDNDNCGVHNNSGVQNHMAYLLAQGGTGWNNGLNSHAPANNGYQWQVAAIGVEKVARIAYLALSNYLGPNATYFDARNAWVHAAIELYGECSMEAIQTGKAWYAVGIGPPAAASIDICGLYGAFAFNYLQPGAIQIAPNCSTVILATNNNIQFTSGTSIALKPGFSAVAGSRFAARVNSDCRFAVY